MPMWLRCPSGRRGQHRAVLAPPRRRWLVRRLNGRIWEAIHALREHRRPLDLYHTALVVRVPEGRFVIEDCWPIPDADGPARGVLVEGPVGSRRLGRWRMFRYEVRCWRDGDHRRRQRGGRQPPAAEPTTPLWRVVFWIWLASLPSPVWGRDELGTGEMWNSNSVIAWLLARSGLPTDPIRPPAGGRAPGWQAGLVIAHRSPMASPHPRANQTRTRCAHRGCRSRRLACSTRPSRVGSASPSWRDCPSRCAAISARRSPLGRPLATCARLRMRGRIKVGRAQKLFIIPGQPATARSAAKAPWGSTGRQRRLVWHGPGG